MQPANNEEPQLVEAEQLYEKILVYNTNRVVTSLSDNISSVSTFTQQEFQQAFHPDFEAIKNDSNDTMNPPL